ncbi:MAG: FHA domain-containing protein [Candidatus Pacebacteria bacterium]|nr:FHA domain-containing protein [Candidatus Paceibacterota bacterium]
MITLRFTEGKHKGESVPITEPEIVIGRDEECSITLQDRKASRQHCLLQTGSEGNIFIQDCGSKNGTLVNGEKITDRVFLSHKDEIIVGNSTIIIEYEEHGDVQTARTSLPDTPLPGMGKQESAEASPSERSTSQPPDLSGTQSLTSLTAAATDDTTSGQKEDVDPTILPGGGQIGEADAGEVDISPPTNPTFDFAAETDSAIPEHPTVVPPETEDTPLSESAGGAKVYLATTVISIVALLVIYLFTGTEKKGDDPAKIPLKFKSPYFTIYRPPFWGDTKFSQAGFLFEHQDDTAFIIAEGLTSKKFRYCALLATEKKVKSEVQSVLSRSGLPLTGKVKITAIKADKNVGAHSGLTFNIRLGEQYEGFGTFFYTNDLQFCYIAADKKGQYLGTARKTLKWIKFNPPYDDSLFERPVMAENPTLEEADKHIEAAKNNMDIGMSLWERRRQNTNNVISAVKRFRQSLRHVALSGESPFWIDRLIQTYRKCLDQRQEELNHLQGLVLQYEQLGEYDKAIQYARQLGAVASSEFGEATMKEWARNKYFELSQKGEER